MPSETNRKNKWAGYIYIYILISKIKTFPQHTCGGAGWRGGNV
jgi:hypothetical protein